MPARIEDSNPGLQVQIDTLGSDPILQNLQDPSFDPVDFLNATLPPTSLSSNQQYGSKPSKSSQIQDTSSKVQELLGKLNAQNIRYSNTLTQLTDEILRSGSRLGYEVEILRGDANGLHEVLTDTLQDDIQKLVVTSPEARAEAVTGDGDETAQQQQLQQGSAGGNAHAKEPEFILQLRMLSQVKSRLEEVINVFGEAMEWPLPPSELSITSSFISVSAPEPGSDNYTTEEKAREIAKKLQAEISRLLESDGGGYEGLDAADIRVEALRSMSIVWKGTAEEKARTKFVDSLAKVVDERRKALDARSIASRPRGNSASQRSSSMPGRPSLGQGQGRGSDRNVTDGNNPAGGLLRNLQRLRDEIYLD